MEATLRLFKAVPVKDPVATKALDPHLATKTIPYGFIFSSVVWGNFDEEQLHELIGMSERVLGLSGAQVNASFHKSWEKVATADIAQLAIEQILHYLTTYGFESLGVYDSDTVFIPAEHLDIPKLKMEGLKLVVIKGLTEEELKSKLLDLCNSGIALKENTIKDICEVASLVNLTESEISTIKNREVKVALWGFLNLIPSDPVEFLRYIIFKTTEKTLLIKDRATISLLKEVCLGSNIVAELFSKYEATYGLEKLARIFYRFKPLFLAMRGSKYMKVVTNRIRKLAIRHHVPMPKDYFNSITEQIAHGVLNLDEFRFKLSELNIFRKIRLANTLSFRANENADCILYKIRNGKGFAKELKPTNVRLMEMAMNEVVSSIADELRPQVAGKTFYIPNNIVYSLPATEKQFVGHFPAGTYVSIPKDLIVGIYWNNVEKARIDLDLSLRSLDVKIGWDGLYRTGTRDVLFSGDMTDATNGASELYYLGKVKDEAYLLTVNFYNAEKTSSPVPFKLFAASEEPGPSFGNSKWDPYRGSRSNSYMVNPNNIIAIADSVITQDKKQKVLGLVVTSKDGDNRFYFNEFDGGNSISAGFKSHDKQARKYFVDYHSTIISLAEVLEKAGATIIREKAHLDVTKHAEYIDLSPNVLEKDTLINLLIKKDELHDDQNDFIIAG